MVTNVTSFSRSGLSDFIVQRLTAVILAAYFLFILGYLTCNGDVSYLQWRELFSGTCMQIFTVISILSLAAHAWIGMWTIATDYLTKQALGARGTVIRIAFQSICFVVTAVYVVWGIQILWGQ